MLIQLSETGQSLSDHEISWYISHKVSNKEDIHVSNIIAFEYACYLSKKHLDQNEVKYLIYGRTPEIGDNGKIANYWSLHTWVFTRRDIELLQSGGRSPLYISP